MKNHTTGQFTGNIRQIFVYLLVTYGKMLPSHLKNFEKEATEIYYDPVTTVEKISNKVEDLLKNCNMSKFPY